MVDVSCMTEWWDNARLMMPGIHNYSADLNYMYVSVEIIYEFCVMNRLHTVYEQC